MIQIYNPDNTEFDYNGDMILQPEEATVHVILGSTWEAEIAHPIDDDGRWAYIVENAVVKMPSFNGEQLWRIVSTKKTDSGVSAAMQPIFYDAANEVFLVDVRPTDKSGQEALDILMEDTKYSGESDTETPYTAYYEYKNLLEALNGDIDQSFVNRWGGEIIYDNFKVIINTEAGEDNGVEIRYGKNIPENGFTVTEDMSEVVTRIYPKAYNGRTMSDDGYVDSEHISDYPTIRAVTMTFEKIKYIDDCSTETDDDGNEVVSEDDDITVCETEDELDAALLAACEAEFDAGCDLPSVTIEADMVLLQGTEQYKDVEVLEEVSLGDTVHIINTHIGFETEARVIELEYDSMLQRITSIVLGDFEADYFSDTSSSVSSLSSSVESLSSTVTEFNTVIAQKIYAIYANFDELVADTASFKELSAEVASISTAYIDTEYVNTLLANYVKAADLVSETATITSATIKFGTIEVATIDTAFVYDLLTAGAIISDSAVIDDVAVTGYLTGVNIVADVITAGTLSVDRLIITGEDSIVYEINASSSGLTATELTEEVYQQYINGTVIVAQSITATQIAAGTITANEIDVSSITAAILTAGCITADMIDVDDLYAIGATIGGFTINSYALYAYSASYSHSYAGIYRPAAVTTSQIAFFAGATSASGSDAYFMVTYGGALTATDATISGTITAESGYYMAKLTSGNLYFYYNDVLMGTYGSTYWSGDSSVRGVRFGLNYECDFMSFSRKTSSDATAYTMFMYFDWTGKISGTADTMIIDTTVWFNYACIHKANETFNFTVYFNSTIYHSNACSVRFYCESSTDGYGYLAMNTSDQFVLSGNGQPLYVYGSDTYLGSGSYATYIRGSGITFTALATTAYGIQFNSAARFANACAARFYNAAADDYAYISMNSSDNLMIYGNGYPVYIYGGAVYLGSSSYATYIYGSQINIASAMAITADFQITAPVKHSNSYGSRYYDSEGEDYAHIFMSSGDFFYISGNGHPIYVYGGDTYLGLYSYDTYVRGSTIYMNGSAYSSDAAVKNHITKMDDRYIDLLGRLIPRSFYYNWNSEDLYNGFVAQEVMAALEDTGIDNDALIRFNPDENIYALDYNGFIPILVAGYQKLLRRIETLEGKAEN